MSREVDERVVAMYFDNKDFEKNAQSTIKTLDELRNGLDLEGAAKGLDTLQKAGKSLNFDRANQSVKTFRNTLSGLSDVAKKAFSGLTAPLQGIESMFETFRGYVGKFVGFDLAGKLVGSLESAVRAVTIEPIMSGWNEYELKMDSIKTIMSGTTESYTKMRQEAESGWVYDEGEHLGYVKQNLEELNRYADKTIYSFADMTANIGKFTNQGVELEDATAAIKGIANAAADAGQGAQQASMAMYNISQALGVGSMKLVDWKSIENANMATARLKNTFLQLGGALGKLKKYTDKDGNIHYFAVDDTTKSGQQKNKLLNEKKINAMTKAELDAYLKKNNLAEVTAENFRESLNENWLDKEVLLKTLQVFSGDELDIDTIMSWGFDEEQARELMKIGEEASKAATEVRTFSKMWDALKEAAQSGWAQSIEYIFGDMQEGTSLWTRLNDTIGGMLNASAENRNNLLLSWRGLERQEDGTIKAIEGAVDGRERLIDGVFQIIYGFQDIGRMFSKASESVFGTMTGEKLLEMTEGFRSFAFQVRNWLGVVSTGESRLAKIRKGIQGVMSVFKTALNFLKIGANLVKRMIGPAADVLIEVFATMGGFFDGMGELSPDQVFSKISDGLGKVWTKLKALFSVGENGTSPISTYFTNLWNDLKKSVRSWANENGLTGTLNNLTNIWDTLKNWEGWTTISGVFENAKAGIEKAWDTVYNWSGWQQIGKFFSDIWGWFTEKQTDAGDAKNAKAKKILEDHALLMDASDMPSNGKTGFVVWLEQVKTSLEGAWNAVTEWEGWDKIGTFFSDTWNWIKEKTGIAVDFMTKPGEDGKTGFSIWIGEIWDEIKRIWGEITEAGRPIWESIGQFAGDTWGWVIKQFGPKDDGVNKGKGDQRKAKDNPVVVFLRDSWESIKTIWNEISVAGKSVWDGISGFITNMWDWVTGQNGSTETANTAKEESAIDQMADAAPDVEKVNILTSVLEAIGGFFARIKEFADELTGNAQLGRIWTTVEKAFEVIGAVVELVVNIAHKAFVKNDTSAQRRIVAMVGLVEGLNLLNTHMQTKKLGHIAVIADNTQSLGLQILEIAGAMALVSVAVMVLSTIDETKIWKAVGQITAIGAVLAGVMVALGYFRSTAKEDTSDPVKWIERLAGKLMNTLTLLGGLGIVMEGLPKVIEAIGKVPDFDGGDLLQTMLSVVTLIGGMGLVFAALDKITGTKGMSIKGTATTAAALVAGLGIIMAGMGAIFTLEGGIVSIFGQQNVDDAVRIIENGGRIFAAVGDAISKFIKGLFGGGTDDGKRHEAETQIAWLGKISDEMNGEQLLKIGNMLELVNRISDLRYDSRNMQLLAADLPETATGLKTFAETLESITVGENADQRVQNLMKMMGVLDAFSNTMRAITDAYYIQAYLDQFGEDQWTSLYELYSSAAGKLAEAVQEGLGENGDITFDATPIIDSIIVALGYGETAIAQAVHTMVQAGINKSSTGAGGSGYTVDDDTSRLLQQLLGGDYMPDGTSLIDENKINTIMYGEDGKSGIVGSLQGALGDIENMDSLGDVLMTKIGGQQFVDEQGNTVDALGMIQESLGNLQTTINELPPFEIEIMPVFNMSNMNAESLREQIRQMSLPMSVQVNGGGMTINLGTIGSQLSGISAKIDGVLARITNENIMNRVKIGEMGERIDRVSSSVQKMRVVLDSGVLVGEISPGIDYSLGERAVISSRTGVSPKWGIPTAATEP